MAEVTQKAIGTDTAAATSVAAAEAIFCLLQRCSCARRQFTIQLLGLCPTCPLVGGVVTAEAAADTETTN